MAQIISPMAMAVRINIWAFTPPQPEQERAIMNSLTPGAERGMQARTMVPVPVAFTVLLGWFLACVAVLARRVRAVEVVK